MDFVSRILSPFLFERLQKCKLNLKVLQIVIFVVNRESRCGIYPNHGRNRNYPQKKQPLAGLRRLGKVQGQWIFYGTVYSIVNCGRLFSLALPLNSVR